MLEDQKAEAQEVLDALFSEHLLPFELCAHKLEAIGLDEYIVHFNDSRLGSVDLSWREGESFKDVLRARVLERVKRLRP